MIVCQQCGYQNDDDDEFCGGCPGYLAHVGTRVADDAVREVAEAEPEEAASRGIVERVKAIVTGEDDTAEAAALTAQAEADLAELEQAAVEERERAAAAEIERAAAAQREAAAVEAEQLAAEREREAAAERAQLAEAERERREKAERAREEAAERRRVREEQRRAEERQRRVEEEQRRAEEEQRAAEEARLAAEDEEGRAAAEAGERKSAAEARHAEDPGVAEAARRVEEQRRAAAEAEERRRRESEETKRREEGERRRAEEERRLQEDAEREAEEAKRREEEERAAAAAAEAERAAAERERAAAAERKRAEEERRTAEEFAKRAAAEAEERARRAAAMVAKPPAPPPVTPAATTGTAAAAAAAPVSPAAGQAGAGQQVGARQPSAQKPAATARPRPPQKKTAPTRVIEPGDLVCGQCGEPNKPERKFCRRCANSLDEAKVAKVSVWKRVFGRRKKEVAAGERPGRRGSADVKGKIRQAKRGRALLQRWSRRIIALLAVVGVAGALGLSGSPVRTRAEDMVQSLRDRFFPAVERIVPVGATLPDGRPVANVTDNTENRHWVAEAPGEGQVLHVQFAEPFDLRSVAFLAGASGDAHLNHARPREVHIVFDTTGSADVELEDTPDFQSFKVSADGVSALQLHFRTLHPGGDNRVALTNVQFQGVRR